ncbi:hypothetical protein SETIT_4G199700v2 [Setaria italica]|uniref:Uncharacterized protein n=1 Tax=Setaria italica TaxID=4555 RepID=A0A368QW34_SETIT|nr:hypothetical protein SETIT_4G199700v2 [Setaria italica]
MVAGTHSRLRGGGNAGGPFRVQIRGRKLGGGDNIGKVDDDVTTKLRIFVHSRRIGRASLRINSQGKVYVPDSEDEDLDMKMDDVAVEGAAVVMVPAARSPTVVVVADADGAPGMEAAADEVPDVELAPEVLARLQVVLVGIDPIYHVVFISFYKVMVSAFFKSN